MFETLWFVSQLKFKGSRQWSRSQTKGIRRISASSKNLKLNYVKKLDWNLNSHTTPLLKSPTQLQLHRIELGIDFVHQLSRTDGTTLYCKLLTDCCLAPRCACPEKSGQRSCKHLKKWFKTEHKFEKENKGAVLLSFLIKNTWITSAHRKTKVRCKQPNFSKHKRLQKFRRLFCRLVGKGFSVEMIDL